MVSHRLVTMLLAGLLTGALAPASRADKVSDTTEELTQLRSRISAIKHELDNKRSEQDKVQAKLEQAETEIGATVAEIHRLDGEISHTREQLGDLQSARQSRLADIRRLRTALVQDMRQLYAAGNQTQVKLLLNQEDPAAVGRMMSYQGYFARARGARVREFRDVLDELAELETRTLEREAELENLRGQQQEFMQRLGREQQQRKSVLAALRDEVSNRAGELAGLERDEQRLQELLASLQRALARAPSSAGAYRDLPPARGRLAWPVAGSIRTAYGANLGTGKPASRGIFISAPGGTEVHAIHKGRVAFADWLRGFGLLLILDHGDGYMSLYGHNQALLRQPGDWVEPGETVAIVGSSGGESQTGLYLELRKDGRPVDPAPWFTGKPAPQRVAR